MSHFDSHATPEDLTKPKAASPKCASYRVRRRRPNITKANFGYIYRRPSRLILTHFPFASSNLPLGRWSSLNHRLCSSTRPFSGLTYGAVLTLQEWTSQQPQQAARRVRPQESSDDQADSSSSFLDLDLSLYHQPDHSHPTPISSVDHFSHPDFLSPHLWSQPFGGSIPPAIDNAGLPPLTDSTLPQDLMTFGQTWTDSGAGFAAEPSLNDYDFSFDPALIDALPASIPDFWLVPPPPQQSNTTDTTPAQDHRQQQEQQQQQLEHLTLNPPQPSSSSTLGPTPTPTTEPRSHASSPSSDSPSNSRAGAGRAATSSSSKRDAEDPEVVVKRQRNTIAARKYRQKRLDRIQELEDALKAMTRERDELRLRLARQEAETAALREMMQMKQTGKGSE